MNARGPRLRSQRLTVGANPAVNLFPAHALVILEERLREQEAEGVRMPEGVPLDELALRILVPADVWTEAAGQPPLADLTQLDDVPFAVLEPSNLDVPDRH
jgi:hypothetical protein